MPATTPARASNDDGLFDATYSFVVPANLTSGTLSVGAGSFSGAEFTLYTAETGNTTLDVTAPAHPGDQLPAPCRLRRPAHATVGRPAAAPDGSSVGHSRAVAEARRRSGFPIWLAVLIVVVLARRGVVSSSDAPRSQAPLRSRRPSTIPTTAAPLAVPPRSGRAPSPIRWSATSEPPSSRGPRRPRARQTPRPEVNVLGPARGLRARPAQRAPIVEELLVYLVLHDHRHLRAGQIQLGMWPAGSARADVQEKTLRNYLSELRSCVGPEHLPEATGDEGYLIEGVRLGLGRPSSAWPARPTPPAARRPIELRTEALALVRGVPFEDVTRRLRVGRSRSTSAPR